jgi:nucleolin
MSLSKKLTGGRLTGDIYAAVDSAFGVEKSFIKSDAKVSRKRSHGDREKSDSKPKVGGDEMKNTLKKKKSKTAGSSSSSAVPSSASSSSSSAASFRPVAEESDLYNGRTVYVEGLPFTATEEDIASFFDSCGSGAIKQMRLPRWQDSGRLKGNGHIEFSSAECVDKALKMNGKYMNQRYVKVERPLPPRSAIPTAAAPAEITVPAGCNTVFIKNLPYDVGEKDVEEYFKVFGPITSVRLARWGHTNQLKGFGYVAFKRPDSAEICVKKSKLNNAVVFKGRVIICDFETGAPKMSFQRQEQKQKIVQKQNKF